MMPSPPGYASGMTLLRWLAAPLSPLYGAVVGLRNRGFDAHPQRAARAERPVISVGNLSVGGTGKTPLTLFLAQGLQEAGWPNAVVSRGYGGRRAVDPMVVSPGSMPSQVGDEPLLMAQRLGPSRVVVARRRLSGTRLALAASEHLRVLLLDDGFQHRALHRDLDLLLLDGVRLWGDGRLLPMGDLREPMASAGRAHALVVTRASRVKDRAAVEGWWAQHGGTGPIFWVDFQVGALRAWPTGPRLDSPVVPEEPLLAWCGLGHPEAFFADLLVAGVRWVATYQFPDHRGPTPASFQTLQALARQAGAQALVCTEKDAVKLTPAHAEKLTMPLWIAEQRVLGGEALLEFILSRLRFLELSAPSPSR